MKSIDPAPILKIGNSNQGISSKVYGSVEVQIMNPLNPAVKAATLVCNYEYKVDSSISSGFNLTAKIDDLKVEVTNYVPLFATDQDTDTVNEMIQMIVPMVQNYFNDIYPQGI